jgi:hypothetical protein
MFYAIGDQVLTSTQGTQSNPTTATLIAQVSGLASQNYEARILCGCSTLAVFHLEQCLSTGLGSTALREGGGYLGRRVLRATVGQTGQYVLRFKGESGDLVRLRVGGSTFTADADATIQLEPLS